MIKITACICFYNAKNELQRCLDSLDLDKKYGIDNALCVDGKYPNFKGNSRLSNDGSRELLQSYENVGIINCPDYEIHKRNAYLQATENMTDFILIIDSDEYVEPENKDWKLFRKQLEGQHKLSPTNPIWGIDIEKNSEDYVDTVNQILGRPQEKKRPGREWIRQFDTKPRLWYHPWELEYFLYHYMWRHKSKKHPEYLRESVFGITCWGVIPGIRLLHDHKLRTQEYLEKRLDYHRWLIQFEQTKVKHYFKHHNYRKLPHNLARVEKWVDKDVLKRQIASS